MEKHKPLKTKIPLEGNIVKDYMLGNTRIVICDSAYINRTQEDIEQTLRNIANIGRRAFLKQCEEEPIEEVYKRWGVEYPNEEN
ncbi:hypothetical protein CLPU_10c01510 [Gottschalkia purinilytica]|uniref:Uncharacterized protein n=1 Tax=Gottschalkia purinilytica TaxID=1503 RepID=A0A0L0W9H8_GOTPU|nr:hypothetical protein [Gottschalkia purinilytica]KNF08096.1 hypothetical protein CLPU_10c01510 [Gottschalkia purinilytica]